MQGCYDEMLPLCKQAKQLQAELKQQAAEFKKLETLIDSGVCALSIMSNTRTRAGIEDLPTLAKELKSNFEQALQNTNTDGATGGGRDAPLKENKE